MLQRPPVQLSYAQAFLNHLSIVGYRRDTHLYYTYTAYRYIPQYTISYTRVEKKLYKYLGGIKVALPELLAVLQQEMPGVLSSPGAKRAPAHTIGHRHQYGEQHEGTEQHADHHGDGAITVNEDGARVKDHQHAGQQHPKGTKSLGRKCRKQGSSSINQGLSGSFQATLAFEASRGAGPRRTSRKLQAAARQGLLKATMARLP